MDVRLGSACASLEPSPHAAIASIAAIAASESTGLLARFAAALKEVVIMVSSSCPTHQRMQFLKETVKSP